MHPISSSPSLACQNPQTSHDKDSLFAARASESSALDRHESAADQARPGASLAVPNLELGSGGIDSVDTDKPKRASTPILRGDAVPCTVDLEATEMRAARFLPQEIHFRRI